MIGTTATARKSVERSEYRQNGFTGTFAVHEQYEENLVNGLFYPISKHTLRDPKSVIT